MSFTHFLDLFTQQPSQNKIKKKTVDEKVKQKFGAVVVMAAAGSITYVNTPMHVCSSLSAVPYITELNHLLLTSCSER